MTRKLCVLLLCWFCYLDVASKIMNCTACPLGFYNWKRLGVVSFHNMKFGDYILPITKSERMIPGQYCLGLVFVVLAIMPSSYDDTVIPQIREKL